jgi:arsenate reductase-like glutaredoxin family protein
LVNTKSQAYKNLQPDLTTLDDEGIAALIAGEPRILKRPLLLHGKKFFSGFKEKEYEELLSRQ